MNKIKYCLIVLSFLIVGQARAAFYDPYYEVRTVKTEHFYIHYPREVASAAKDLMDIVERVHDKLAHKMKWDPWGRTHIVLVDKTDFANGLATVIPANYLLLYVSPPDADSSLDNYKNYLELLFTHEYTHILHIDQHNKMADPFHWVLGKIVAPNGLTPSWMREGIAAWNETTETGKGRGNGTYADMILRSAIYENKFPKIDQVAGLGFKFPGADSAYMYGVKFFMWLQEKYGAESIQRYSEEYSSGLWLFSLNNKARRVFGKSFYKLWNDWQGDLKAKYFALRDEITRKGLTGLTELESSKDQLFYPTPHPSSGGYAYVDSSLDESSKIVITQPGQEPVTIKRAAIGQLSFSKDGGNLMAYCAQSGVKKYHIYNEVYVYDLAKKRIRRLAEKGHEKESMRASDPDFAPIDGGRRWLVMVRTNLGTDNLYAYDIATHKGYYLTDTPKYTQFSNPRFSPDGQSIVVSRRDSNGNRDLVLYSSTGTELRKLTNDEARDNHPVWADNSTIYFDSDKSGVSNIYRINIINSDSVSQVSNVLTGVFKPQVTKDGKSLLVEYFSSTGFGLRRMDLNSTSYTLESGASSITVAQALPGEVVNADTGLDTLPEGEEADEAGSPQSDYAMTGSFHFNYLNDAADPAPEEDSPGPTEGRVSPEDKHVETKVEPVADSSYAKKLEGKPRPSEESSDIVGSTKYNAFPQVLVPRYIVPTFATLDAAYLVGFSIGQYDPLYRHNWSLSANYRSDAAYVGASGVYSYTRYWPSFFLALNRYALDWGDTFGVGSNYFEQRMSAALGVSFPFSHHLLSLSYFFEYRDNLTDLAPGQIPPNLGHYAGLHLSYIYSRYKHFANSISQENGPFFKFDADWTDSLLGSSDTNEQVVLTGDMRYYFEMPWSDHHVFGLRAAGAYVFGDRDTRGTFRFGGPFGEEGSSSRLMPFRGLPGVTFANDRMMLLSAEYRIPLANVERGIGTWPIFLRQVHLGIFSDYGDSWARGGKDNVGFFDDFFLSVGTELRGNFVLGYGLPLTARLGYAVILTNRDQIAGLTDSTFGMDVRNGTVYLQFGSSF